MTVRLLSNPHVSTRYGALRMQGNIRELPAHGHAGVAGLPMFHKAEGVQSDEPAGGMPVQSGQSDSYTTGAAYCVGSPMVRAWTHRSIGNLTASPTLQRLT
jgi:hypothetical protein